MRAATDLKERIIGAAEDLFRRHGFERTTNKHIADAVGCTTAALYYYYPEGKQQLLREVANQNARAIAHMIESTRTAISLSDLLAQLNEGITRTLPEMAGRMHWLQAEFCNLSKRDQEHLRKQFVTLHGTLKQQLARFVSDPDMASQFTWLLMCAVMGHSMIFDKLEMPKEASFTREQLFQTLTRSVGLQK
jgi:AcrR family transcriptional regulator